MKQIIAVVVLTAVFIGAAIYTNYYLRSSSVKITNHIKNVEIYAKKNDWTGADKELRLSKENWENVKDKWAILIDHFEIDNIDSSISRVSGFVATKNLNDVLAESSNLRLMIDHIPERELPSFKNVL